jgi:hypothetical protein
VSQGVIEVRVARSDGGSVPDADLLWFDEFGAEIGRGHRLDLSGRRGEQVVRAVLRNTGFGQAERTFTVRGRDVDTERPCKDDSWWPPKPPAKGG